MTSIVKVYRWAHIRHMAALPDQFLSINSQAHEIEILICRNLLGLTQQTPWSEQLTGGKGGISGLWQPAPDVMLIITRTSHLNLSNLRTKQLNGWNSILVLTVPRTLPFELGVGGYSNIYLQGRGPQFLCRHGSVSPGSESLLHVARQVILHLWVESDQSARRRHCNVR